MNISTVQRGLTRRESVLIGPKAFPAELDIPANSIGIVVLADDSQCSQRSSQHLYVARVLRSFGLGTLRFDLVTAWEALDRHPVLDVPLLGARVNEALTWLGQRSDLAGIPLGLLGAGEGAAPTLLAAAREPEQVGAVVLCGGRLDLAGAYLTRLRVPTLLMVGSEDVKVLGYARAALHAMHCTKKLEVLPGTTCSFEEPGTLDVAAGLAGHWFEQYLPRQESP